MPGLRVRSIIVPTDFSPLAEQSLRYAAAFAAQVGARITLLNVIEPMPTPDLEYFPLVVPTDKAIVEARHDLELLPEEQSLQSDLFANPVVRTGVAFHEITEAARSLQADLIIMATHGFSGAKRFWLGSTAERVVRHAGCPVLVVRGKDGAQPTAQPERGNRQFQLSRIIVPTDFSDQSKAALRYAARFADACNASLHLVYVIDSIGKLRARAALESVVDMASVEAAVRNKLAELANEEVGELVPVYSEVRSGKASDQIVALAETHDADLIVISTHGRTGMRHVLIGSVAEQVVRQAPCPVLVVRKAERDFV